MKRTFGWYLDINAIKKYVLHNNVVSWKWLSLGQCKNEDMFGVTVHNRNATTVNEITNGKNRLLKSAYRWNCFNFLAF